MKIVIKLTEDHLKLISNIKMDKVPELSKNKPYIYYGIDYNSLYGGSYILQDIAYILGRYDEHIEGTEERWEGPAFPEELEVYMYKLHFDVFENIGYIEDLVHYYSNKGGLKPGIYTCKDYEMIWSYKEFAVEEN